MARTFTLGRYTCVERLGTGPAGELWRAKRFGLAGVEKQFLLTKLHPALKKDAAGMARLQATLKSYSELEERRGLLSLCEQGTQGSDAFLVYEFPGFADLRKLRSGLELVVGPAALAGLWPQLVLLVGRTLAATLAAAHQHGLWHGFLSPASVYIDAGSVGAGERPAGRVLLADLGLGQLLPPGGWATDVNLKVLQQYLPKELQSGASPGPDFDIYGLGVLLTELLAGATGEGDADGQAAATGLRPLLDGCRAVQKGDRPQTMRELLAGLEAIALPQQAKLAGLLAQVAQQFEFAGDTVPQPVNIAERSSAEPLPPPPGSRSGEGKVAPLNVNLSGAVATARNRASAPGDKPAKPPAPPARPTPPPKPPAAGGGTVTRSEAEDTPLPESRPLLVTYPKIEVPSVDGTAAKSAEPSSAIDKAKAAGSDGKRPRSASKTNLEVMQKNARSGMDWLQSTSGQVDAGQAAAQALQESSSAQNRTSGPNQQVAGGSPSKPPGKRANPVSVNPRAAAGKASPSASAATPTAEVDVESVGEQRLAGSDAAPAKRSERSSNLQGAAAALTPLSSDDHLSATETNPALSPVRSRPPKSQLGDEPTNPVSLEEVNRAAAALPQTEGAPLPGARGRTPEPSRRISNSAAPAHTAEPSGGTDVFESTNPANSLDAQLALPAAAGASEPSAPPLKPRRSPLLLGGVLLGLVGLVVLVVVLTRGGPSSNLGDGGPPADAGTAERVERIPAESLVLSSTPPAAILVDGEAMGKTPSTVKVKAGKHKLVLIAEGHTLLKREVSGGSKLDITLERAALPADTLGPAQLKISCKSEGKVRILVDGQDSGHSCPSDDISLSAGKHVIGFLDPATDEVLKEKKLKLKVGKKKTKPTKIKMKV